MTRQKGSRARWLVLAALLLAIAVQRVQRTARHSPSFVQVADGAYRWEPAAAGARFRLQRAAEWPGDALEGAICCAEGLFPLQGGAAAAAAPACRLPPITPTAALAPHRLTQHWYLLPGLTIPIPVSVGLFRGDRGWVSAGSNHGGSVQRSSTARHTCLITAWRLPHLPAHSPPCFCSASGGCGRRHQEQPAPVTCYQPGEGCAGGHPCWRARRRHCMCVAAAAGWWQRLGWWQLPALQLPHPSAVVQHCQECALLIVSH